MARSPIVVRAVGRGGVGQSSALSYQLLTGETRWRAHKCRSGQSRSAALKLNSASHMARSPIVVRAVGRGGVGQSSALYYQLLSGDIKLRISIGTLGAQMTATK